VHGEVQIKASHWMVIENVIDMAHVPYVHAGTVGDHAAFVDIDIHTTPTALNFAFPIENHHGKGEEAKFRVDTKATACLPSTSFIRFRFPWGLRLVTINSVVPIDEHTTVIRFCQMRNFLRMPAMDPLIRRCAPSSLPFHLRMSCVPDHWSRPRQLPSTRAMGLCCGVCFGTLPP
jgi:phenylpropionate dioxygenase-like ring-hydroxylating dioxygenase large terminal subunit